MNSISPCKLSLERKPVYNMQQRLLDLTKKTGYPIRQVNGQRYFGPPTNWTNSKTPRNSEVFIARLPKHSLEDDLYKFCSQIGTVYLIRMMVNHDGTSKGFCFVTFTTEDEAKMAINLLPQLKFLQRYNLSFEMSDENRSIEIIRIDPLLTNEQIQQELHDLLENITHISLKRWPDNSSCKAFVYFDNHQGAAYARRRLSPIVSQTFGIGSRVILVDKKMKEKKKEPGKENKNLQADVELFIEKNRGSLKFADNSPYCSFVDYSASVSNNLVAQNNAAKARQIGTNVNNANFGRNNAHNENFNMFNLETDKNSGALSPVRNGLIGANFGSFSPIRNNPKNAGCFSAFSPARNNENFSALNSVLNKTNFNIEKNINFNAFSPVRNDVIETKLNAISPVQNNIIYANFGTPVPLEKNILNTNLISGNPFKTTSTLSSNENDHILKRQLTYECVSPLIISKRNKISEGIQHQLQNNPQHDQTSFTYFGGNANTAEKNQNLFGFFLNDAANKKKEYTDNKVNFNKFGQHVQNRLVSDNYASSNAKNYGFEQYFNIVDEKNDQIYANNNLIKNNNSSVQNTQIRASDPNTIYAEHMKNLYATDTIYNGATSECNNEIYLNHSSQNDGMLSNDMVTMHNRLISEIKNMELLTSDVQ